MCADRIYEDLSPLRKRSRIVWLAIEIAFAGLVFFYWKIQVLDYRKYWAQAEANRTREIALPAPRGVLTDRTGAVVGNGFEGEVFLLVALTPPATLAPGTSVTLAAAAEWLMCDEVCMPGNASLSLTLPVAEATPATAMARARCAARIAANGSCARTLSTNAEKV